jgi:hypothetical protein
MSGFSFAGDYGKEVKELGAVIETAEHEFDPIRIDEGYIQIALACQVNYQTKENKREL